MALTKKKKMIFGGIIAGLVVILALVLIFGSDKEKIVQVQTEKAARRNITQIVVGTGKIDAINKVVITPEVTGEIVNLPVKEGQKVKKGDLLIKIKSDQYQAALDRLVASLQASKSSLNSIKAAYEKAFQDYNRVSELHKKGLASDAELEMVKATYLSRQGEYEAQKAMVLQSEAAIKEQKEIIAKTAIYSPIDGTVTGLNVKLGERVLGSNFTQGTNLMTIADLSNMEAVIDINENDIINVKIGQKAIIEVDAIKGKKFLGEVYEIANSPKTTGLGTQEQVVNFSVKIKIYDKESELKPGMSCNAEIETDHRYNVLSIPLQAVTARSNNNQDIQEDNNNTQKKEKDIQEIVFIHKNGLAKIQNVKTGISDDNYIEIIDGLKEDDEVITGPYKAISTDLEDNTKVVLMQKNKNKK
ncbi:MAG TPA: efflux RND transporter periplasmic adaptor subunit [Ignavibacteriales bacterium]|nr:efflux RND transporter periplasmic adaptor subunit [Ignavibacteriales bacterium]HOL80835.1 efflux RND transporter periplasmic adaptor subunit [Ignavibacteriales bacterium]HOM65862.1 efflux RND transporter periplasmic adaptor subunit [Ignavibacteriales bacterium]HPD67618.1 efflux RND transporter periplasmic adaptor subunit [Ignavibacteriales bacterium]HPP33271.1 efflux RND transporter periplasmic adaptor subunit [Ignavibacteriales bacterium]